MTREQLQAMIDSLKESRDFNESISRNHNGRLPETRNAATVAYIISVNLIKALQAAIAVTP